MDTGHPRVPRHRGRRMLQSYHSLITGHRRGCRVVRDQWCQVTLSCHTSLSLQWPLAGLARVSASTCAGHPIIHVSTLVHVHVHGVYPKIIILTCGSRSEVTRPHHQAESEDHRDFPALVYHRKPKETHSKNMYVPCLSLLIYSNH